jgi:hypothetical protein
VPATKVDAVPLEQADLFLGQDQRGVLGDGLLRAKEALQSRLQVVAQPDAPDAGRTHRQALEAELVGDTLSAMRRMVKAIGQDSRLDLGTDPVRVRTARTATLLDERLHATDLEGAADFGPLSSASMQDLRGRYGVGAS